MDFLSRYNAATLLTSFYALKINPNFLTTSLPRKCWCVDKITGIEIQGTRWSPLSSLGADKINCTSKNFCRHSCSTDHCEHGVKLDEQGCPLNDRCECQNACEVSIFSICKLLALIPF